MLISLKVVNFKAIGIKRFRDFYQFVALLIMIQNYAMAGNIPNNLSDTQTSNFQERFMYDSNNLVSSDFERYEFEPHYIVEKEIIIPDNEIQAHNNNINSLSSLKRQDSQQHSYRVSDKLESQKNTSSSINIQKSKMQTDNATYTKRDNLYVSLRNDALGSLVATQQINNKLIATHAYIESNEPLTSASLKPTNLYLELRGEALSSLIKEKQITVGLLAH